ncbi:ATP-binding protein [Shewanella surugensis]|uniref:ATP-binding protein n=1 Tax=Shewanella surugensis TaxID=212020 RepID=A0ABT0L9P4_9GAMM|nr:ATP-binding protein [Shewanella surugensis]MCL1124284.1 ATP-binding protein [Shewanella surugensis]
MPSLHRIILIDTHLPGVVELMLDGHTNICGTNASGKTTLQRLVPVFYGEYPSRVVPSTRDSFERWYLPHESSYIIFEYQKSDGLMYQGVLASAGDGKGVNYRFIAKGFTLEDYTKSRENNQLVCYTMAELGREYKRAGISTTKLLNTREYRSIIQNDKALLSTGGHRSELRTYAKQFSLCDGEHALRHIEKLAKAVHSKEGKMETVKSMVAAILEEDGVTPPSSRLNPQHVEAWIRESQLIQGFEKIGPEFDKLEQEFDQLLSVELRLSGLTQGYVQDEGAEIERQECNQALSKSHNYSLQQLDREWKEQRDELNLDLSAAKGDLAKCEDELESIENQYDTFLETDIERAKADLEKLPTWQSDKASFIEQHKLQTEQHQDVEAAYNARCSQIGEQLNRSLEQLHLEQDKQRGYLDTQNNFARGDIEALEQEWRLTFEEKKAESSEQHYQLKLSKAQLLLTVNNVAYTEDEKMALAVFDERISRADEEQEACNAKFERMSSEERKLRSLREQSHEALRIATMRVSERQAELEQVEHVLFPESHTLLEFLRRDVQGWESSLGKVINESLLHRSDLNPHVIKENIAGVYGLGIDLKAIESPRFAQSEQALRIEHSKAEEALLSAKALQADAEEQLVAATEQLDKMSRELTFSRTAYQNSREDLRRLLDEKRTEQETINHALALRKRDSQKQLTVLEGEIKLLKQSELDWQAAHKEQMLDLVMEKKAYWQDVIGVIETQLTQIKVNIEQRRQAAKADKQACEQWYKNELKSCGVDEAQILKLKQDIAKLESQIVDADLRRSEVLRFEDWYQHTWLKRKPKLQTQLSDVKRETASLEQQLKAKAKAVKVERDELDQKRKVSDSAQVEASENLSKLRSLLRKLSELKLPKNKDEVQGHLPERLRQSEELLLKRDYLLGSVKQYVEHFDSVIASKSGSGLAEFWERAREESSFINDKSIRLLDYRKLVPQLAQLLNVMVPQSVTALREQGRIFGVDLTAFYDVLVDIDRRIVTQSARITREVSEELFLEGVSGSEVKIRSRISELEFWPELEAFVKAFTHWKAEGFTGLPGEDYIVSMRRALDIIGRSALTGGIAKLLEIELRLKEGNSDLVIRTDRQLNESSSHGMAYLILCKFLLAFTRLLRGRSDVTVHWPIDELGTLHHSNVKKIFDACENNNILVLGAFPNPESEVLNLFSNRYIINKQTRQLQVVKPQINVISEKLKQKWVVKKEAS